MPNEHQMNSAPHLDNSSIPILTEVISLNDVQEPFTQEQTNLVQTVKAELSVQVQHNQSPEQDWEQLEKTLRENVLRQLLTRVDFVLEHRVRDGLADVLQTAVDGLAQEIRQGLSKSLEEVIHRTISQEISKIQSANSKN
ncbi:hypothetical protein S2091_3249 [Solimicrobium silvestre]|uniref:Uncharacterized protein n=2 Tax=Solimicrobium silvestre TaxID=2099400 RepID=A0A2S9GWM2_9BURK|nr:hypothetical protein S2091_3249 [Solimicrobium silvestre]